MNDDSKENSPPHNTLFNRLDAKLDNNLQLKTNSSYRELTAFLRDYKSDDSADTNIIDQGQKIAYNIPEKLLPRFFEILEKCRKDKLTLNFSEKQLDPSGIMLDFDILQDSEKSQLDDSHFYSLTRHIIEMLASMISFDDEKVITYVMILRKTKTEYKDVDKCFKDGFHMLIPGIKIKKVVKKYLIKRILEEEILGNVFDEVQFRGDINSILDKNSAHVVTLFPGNCKSGKVPYAVHRIYRVEVKKSKVANLIQYNFDEAEEQNLVYDFSVNYIREGGLVDKTEVLVNEEVTALISQWSCKPSQEDKKNKDDLSILNMHDPDSDQLKRIIDILKPERCGEYKYWFGIVCALAYMNERYKALALYFSGKRPTGVRIEFEKVWLEASCNRNKYSYSKEMIYNYAKSDDFEQYKTIMSEGVFSKLTESIFDQKIGGYVDHWHIAQILKEMVGGKFVVDFDESTSALSWYEFVLEDDPHIPGEIYKWRCCNDPHTLRNYVSLKVPIVFDRALEYLTNRKNNSAEEEQIKYYNSLIKVVIQSSRKLYNHGFKNGVIRESESIFRKMNFAKQLDKEENLMGVGNGVLVFDKVPTLITSYHHHKISRYSAVNYKKIDPKDPIVQAVFKSIWDLFPEGEKDAFHYVMFFLCTSLTGRLKACLFLTLRGNGANGKSYLMELVRNLLGGVNEMGYGCKLPIQYLIEREPMSNNASPVLVPLTYARLTYFSESDKSEQLRVSKKKKLTSHEPINVRPLYGKQQNIIHKSNFVLETNYALTIDTTDHGTWRRERYYTMKIKFCKDPNPEHKYERQDDPTFSTKKARDPEFLSGVLSILSMYFSILDMKYKGDINEVPCPTITRETEIFRNSQDIINRFITERVVITPDDEYEMSFTDLVDQYCRWYDANVKERRHDRLDISLMFKNSRLSNAVVKKINGSLCIKGHRVLGPAEEKGDDERFIVEPMGDLEALGNNEEKKGENEVVIGNLLGDRIKKGDDPRYESSNTVLQKTFDEYIGLIKEHKIEYW
jgi:phage/plasmid-associated DNA primase